MRASVCVAVPAACWVVLVLNIWTRRESWLLMVHGSWNFKLPDFDFLQRCGAVDIVCDKITAG